MDALAHLRPDGDERRFAAHVADLAERALEQELVCYTDFLDPRRMALASAALRNQSCSLTPYGGYEGAERVVLGISSADLLPRRTDYPVDALTILFAKDHPVSHRDILGSLMSLRIKREAVGDILVGDCLAVVFLLRSVAAVVQSELTKIGGAGVRCAVGQPQELPAARRTEQGSGIVSSMRLDCVVAMLTSESRTDAAKRITSGLVQKNAQVVCALDAAVCDGDVLSVRGYGKFAIGPVGSKTGKGRLHLAFQKYS